MFFVLFCFISFYYLSRQVVCDEFNNSYIEYFDFKRVRFSTHFLSKREDKRNINNYEFRSRRFFSF